MPDLLLELRSEEIPARMQRRAAEDLRRLVTDALVERGFLYEGAKAFATPRRLALHVAGLPPRGQASREERRGPRVGAPEAAVQGFLKGAGLASLDQARTVEDPKKGAFYLAVIERPGRATLDVLAEILREIVRAFPWPKAMRWGAASAEPGALRWVRPLQSIVATFGPETETPEVVPFEVDGIRAGAITYGHRFLAPGPIEVRRFDDYVPALERAFVVLDADRRKDIILHDARDLAFAGGLDLVEDEGLLEEVAGLVEWPVVLRGAFEAGFLDIPAEAVRATIRANQKCFVLREAGTERLAPAFLLVSNLAARDGGLAITAGNERVVRARLSDAKFFWDQDRAASLESRLPKLDAIVFHEKLGTQGQRVARIRALARALAPLVGADPDRADAAARLAKADLVTEMVGEFPELQGLMGARYAALEGWPAGVCAAIEEHYKPLGPSDRVPSEPVAVAVALADKLDTLVGFWLIGETPTGSKDPYALRRAGLGIIRITMKGQYKIRLNNFIAFSVLLYLASLSRVISTLDFKALASDIGVAALDLMDFMKRNSWFEYKIINYDNLISNNLRVWNGVVNEAYQLDYGDAAVYKLEDGSLCITNSFLDEAPSEVQLVGVAARDAYDAIVVNLENVVRARGLEILKAKDLLDNINNLDQSLYFDDVQAAELLYSADRVFSRNFPEILNATSIIRRDIEGFFADRLKVYLRDQGARHDLVDAVFALPGQDDLLLIVRRVEALRAFLDTDDGRNLLAATKRAANILRIEEKRDGRAYDAAPDADRAAAGEPAERALAAALERARAEASAAVAAEDFAGAMRALSALRAPVDAFFEDVTVNAPEPALRENRLLLLNALRAATRAVADFSKIEG